MYNNEGTSELDDATLVLNYKMGDDLALVELFRRHHWALFRTAAIYLSDEDEIAAVLSRKITQLHRYSIERRQQTFEKSIKAYLMKIVKHGAIDVDRKKNGRGKNRRAVEENNDVEQLMNPSSNVTLEESIDLEHAIKGVLTGLERKIMELTIEGYETDYIKDMLDIEEREFRNKRRQAIKRLRKHFGIK